MRVRLVVNAVLVLMAAPLAVPLHAQSALGPQMGSTLGGGSASASNGGASRGGTLIAVPEDFSKLKIAPGFLLDVEVYDEPDLSVELRVGDDGNVILPLVGPMHVAGITPTEAQQEIQVSFKSAGILKHPQVTLNIAQYAPTMVTVLGEVKSPGRLQMLAPHSLLDVMSFVGGETSLAGGEIEVRHVEAGQATTSSYHYGRNSDGDTISKVTVHDGDTVIVPRAGIVYVLGAVFRPGGYLMQEDGKIDVMQAISLAGGTILLAKTGTVRIVRRKSDGTFVEFVTSYKDIAGGKITPPQLMAQDIVYVPISKVKTMATSGLSLIYEAAVSTVYGEEAAKQ
jgi:polysaccharide export outer membrane protein